MGQLAVVVGQRGETSVGLDFPPDVGIGSGGDNLHNGMVLTVIDPIISTRGPIVSVVAVGGEIAILNREAVRIGVGRVGRERDR